MLSSDGELEQKEHDISCAVVKAAQISSDIHSTGETHAQLNQTAAILFGILTEHSDKEGALTILLGGAHITSWELIGFRILPRKQGVILNSEFNIFVQRLPRKNRIHLYAVLVHLVVNSLHQTRKRGVGEFSKIQKLCDFLTKIDRKCPK